MYHSSLSATLAESQETVARERNAKRAFYAKRAEWHGEYAATAISLSLTTHNTDSMAKHAYRDSRDAAHYGRLALEMRS